jgi:serine/threonine protein kinase
VLHQVGAGTTGLVFRAHDSTEGRLVAIKAFRLDLVPEHVAELARTLQALTERGLSHPSIASPIAAGVEDGIVWFAQAYVPAESLDSALRQYGPPPAADALTIVTQLAGALDFAAAAGVIHGSLHPRDVLVAPGETHLVDLGVATALESCGVRAPVRRPYSAPERGMGRPLSRAGDIFSLAAIAFELLSGQPVTGAGDDVIAALPEIPGANRDELLETFSFALALAPDERYASALAFAAPLKRALGDALTRPAPPRKRRTTRSSEGLLPIGALDDDGEPRQLSRAEAATKEVSGRTAAYDPSLDTGPASFAASRDASTPLAMPVHTEDDDAARVLPAGRRPLGSRRDEPGAFASAYLPGPTEPEPSAPAIEPIAAPGEADPLAPDVHGTRYASLDDEAASPLDAVPLNAPIDYGRRWDMSQGAGVPQPSRVPDDDMGRPGVPDYAIGDDPGYVLPERPDYMADQAEAHEPAAGDYASRDYATALDPEPAPPEGARWLALAAMLVVGVVAGLGGGWFLFGGRGDRTSAAAPSATSSRDAGATRPREWTDSAVRQPGGTASKSGTPAPPGGTPAPKPAPDARTTAAAAPAGVPTQPTPRGRLTVRTRPSGARVEIGGRGRGESPATVGDLAYGQHTVRVSREGYGTEVRRVTLSARRPAQTVDVTLKRNAPPAAAPAAGGRTTRAPAGAYAGTLVVESRPVGATVFLDGQGVGVTPLTLSNVSIGSHVVRLDLAGHRRWSTSIRVVAGERERVAASLEEETSR